MTFIFPAPTLYVLLNVGWRFPTSVPDVALLNIHRVSYHMYCSAVLVETDVLRVLPKALAAHHDVVLTDDCVAIPADAAGSASRAVLPRAGVRQVRHGCSEEEKICCVFFWRSVTLCDRLK